MLLLSIDGMHAADLYKWVTNNPRSSIGRLYLHAIDYPNATTTTPSGDLPGMLALATGGTPKTTGVYDEDSYDRTLFPPGSNCAGSPGTEVIYDGTLAQDSSQLISPINPANLPLTKDAQGKCAGVYPHAFLRASTLFEAVQSGGRRTSWADNHASSEILSGPSGKGLSELYAPEVKSSLTNGGTVNGVNLAASLARCDATNSVGTASTFNYATCLPAAQAYDDVKVQSVINKIDGFSSDGSKKSAVPTFLGLNFEELEVAQKLPMGGYSNAVADPSALLLSAFQHIDFSIGRILTELDSKHFIDSTLVVLTAKHGQAPIDPTLWQTENGGPGSGAFNIADPRPFVQAADANVDGVFAPFTNPNDGRSPAVNGHVQSSDAAIVWLQDQNNVNVSNVVQVLNDPTNQESFGATERPQGSIFSTSVASGTELAQTYGDPQSSDPIAAARAPNVFVQPNLGVLYTTRTDEIADHGGGASDDINVPLLLSNTGIVQHVSILQPVSTTQAAPTIARALALDGSKLTAAMAEATSTLPGITWGPGTYQAGSTIRAVDFTAQTSTQVAGAPAYVGHFDAGSSICFNDVSLTGVVSISATIASNNSGGVFTVRTDSPTGGQIGRFTVQSTGGWTTFKSVSIPVTATTGVHTLCFHGETGTGIANLLSFLLVPVCVPECTGATCGSDGCGGSCGTCGFNFLCDNPFGQCVTPPTKYSVVDTTLLSTIPAPAFDVQSGTQLATGGASVGSFDANDYLCYYGVDLTNVQTLVTSLASASSGGVLSLRIDSPTGQQIATYTVPSTGGGTTFKSKQIPISIPTVGSHALCVRGETGNGIANFQSFQLSASPVVPTFSLGSVIPAVPPDRQQGTTNDPAGFVGNFDATDFVCYDGVSLTGVSSIVANVASNNGNGVFSVRLGSPTGAKIAVAGVPNTGSWTTFRDLTVNITPSTGITTLCFVGESANGIGNLRTFTLSSTLQPARFAVGNLIPATPPDSQQGITSTGGNIGFFDANDWFCYDGVDLTGVNTIVANAASGASGGRLSVRVGSQNGLQIGSFTAFNTGGYSTYTSYNIGISGTPGVQKLCIFGVSGSGIANVRTLLLQP